MLKPIEIKDFGYGLMTKGGPTDLPPGAALVSFDCDYNSRSIQNRKGYQAVLENGPGAVKVADFESGESWTGGAADTTNFILTEAEADGARGRQLTVAATGGGATASMELTVAKNLGTDPLDVFHLWLNVLSLPATVTDYYVSVAFQTSALNVFSGLFLASAAYGVGAMGLAEQGVARYSRIRRQDFAVVGTPDWTNITKITIQIQATGSGTFTVTVDNLHRTPGLMQDLFQFRRQSGPYAGGADFYAVANGTLYRSDAHRWIQVAALFDQKAPVYSITAFNRRILSDGVTTPRVLMPDGATTYRLGIVTPPKQMTATQIGGGGLPDGDYYAQVLFYSSKTGEFSAPDDRVPKTPIITIAGGGDAAGIRFANLPVSSDPQVDYLVIGVRPLTEPTLFFRVSDGLHGDVANGTTTYDFKDNLATLLARSLTAIDPDMDYPSVVDASTGLPIEAHPKFLAEASGYILAVMAEAPTVLRVSRFRQPGAWQLDDEFPLGEDDQEALTGIAVSASNILAMKKGAVYPGSVVGGDERIRLNPPISDRGAVSHKAMAVMGYTLFYRALDGMYRVPLDLVPRKITDLAQPTWAALWDPYGVGGEAAVPLRDADQVLCFGRSLGALRNDTGWVTHARSAAVEDNGKWPSWAPSLWRIPADVACEVRPESADGSGWQTWIGGLGQVFRINFGAQDDGRPIDFVHRTALWTPGSLVSSLWRYIDLEVACSGNFSLDVRAFVGTAIVQDGAPSALLKGNADVFPLLLGTDSFGVPKYVAQRVNLPFRVGRYLSLEFHATSRAHIEITKIKAWASILGARRAAA